MENIERRRPQEPWRPTKDFYLTNPRSAELREVGLGIVRRLDALLHDPKVSEDQEKQSQLYAELEAQGGRLIELGIEPDMHVGKPEEAFKSSPVTMAEYVAGQLFETTGAQVISERDISSTVQEMSETSSGSAHFIKGENVTPRLRDFMVMRSMVNVGYHFFGAQPEETYQIEDDQTEY